MKKTALFGSLLFLLPAVAFAQQGNLNNIKALVVAIGSITNALIPILIAATVVVFFWGLIKYVMHSGKNAANGKGIMIGGVIALFIELSLWGIIIFAQNSLGIGSNAIQGSVVPPTVPQVNNI
jgi:hypothetical protein